MGEDLLQCRRGSRKTCFRAAAGICASVSAMARRTRLPPAAAEFFHPYSDMFEEGIEVLAYDYVEAFAENFGNRRIGRIFAESVNRIRLWRACRPGLCQRRQPCV